ncbi:MAG: hypothetical protein KAG66_20645, partial [Methylococcales bacterium]|nr:hypothetical protein [Methylococcales bacterium]
LEVGLPYLASLAAYEALGAQRKAAPLDLLLEASQVEGFNGVAQSGALHGLAATRQSKAVDHLLKAVDYGANSNRVRPAAIIALASIGQGQEKGKREEIVEKLIDLLRDPWYRAHRAAATGLQMMEATEAVPALKAYVSRLAHQDQVTTESGVIAALQGSDKSDGSAVKKQVEELQATIRKLENRIEDLEAAK